MSLFELVGGMQLDIYRYKDGRDDRLRQTGVIMLSKEPRVYFNAVADTMCIAYFPHLDDGFSDPPCISEAYISARSTTSLRSIALTASVLSCPEDIEWLLLKHRNMEEIIVVVKYGPTAMRGRLTLSDVSIGQEDESTVAQSEEAKAIEKLRRACKEAQRRAVLHVYALSIWRGCTGPISVNSDCVIWEDQIITWDEGLDGLVDPAEVEKIFKCPTIRLMEVMKDGVKI